MLNIIPALWAAPAGGGGDFLQLVPLLLVLVVMYFFFIRTQQKKDKQHKDMVSSLKVGDTVVTQSGFIGQIKRFVDDQEVLLTVSEGTDVRFLKAMLAKVWDGKETKQVRNLKKAKVSAKSPAKASAKKGVQASEKGNT